MKVSLTTLKSVLMLNAVLLGMLLLKPLFTAPAQAQQGRASSSPGNYQIAVYNTTILVLDTRDGTTKMVVGGRKSTGYWNTDYKELQ